MTLDEDGQDEVVGMICIKDPEARNNDGCIGTRIWQTFGY